MSYLLIIRCFTAAITLMRNKYSYNSINPEESIEIIDKIVQVLDLRRCYTYSENKCKNVP